MGWEGSRGTGVQSSVCVCVCARSRGGAKESDTEGVYAEERGVCLGFCTAKTKRDLACLF